MSTTTSSSDHCSLITDHSSSPLRPEWDPVRETAAAITHHGRLFLRGQVRLGLLLAGLKKSHGIHRGQPQKNSPDSGEYLPWDKIVLQETGFARQRGDEFIRLYEATVAKLKRSKYLTEVSGPASDALALFRPENALALTEKQWEMVDTLIGTLTTGETQATLLTELGVIARPRPMPTSAQSSHLPAAEITAGQLAFHFFEGVAASLINTRLSPDYLKLLHALPLHSTSEQPLSLATLESETRAILADIESVKQSTARPTKGRVL